MKEYKDVRGTMDGVPNLEINKDTVYLRSNIIEIDEEDFTGWQYDEVQYTLQEYIKVISDNSIKTIADLDYIAVMSGVEL